jgi:hypothetical protein
VAGEPFGLIVRRKSGLCDPIDLLSNPGNRLETAHFPSGLKQNSRLRPGFEFPKHIRIQDDVLDHLGPYPQLQILQKLAHLFAINQFDLRGPVASRLPLGVGGEASSGL